MKNHYHLLLASLFMAFSLNPQAQDVELAWTKSMGGSSADGGMSIAVDALGNIYTTGNFMGTADFDPDSGTNNLTSAGYFDIFIQKLDANGDFLWAKSMGGSSYDYGMSIAVDVLGNVYTTGFFQDTVDFDPGSGTQSLTSAGGTDIFIQKLDANGDFLWAKSMGGSYYDFGYSITVDASGNVYLTGYFNDTVDFDPGSGTYDLTSSGGTDIFIQKLDANGNFLWAKSMGGNSSDYGYSNAVDASGNIYTTGTFCCTVDYDLGSGIYNLTSTGDMDIFIQKLDSNGNFVWAKSMGGSSFDNGSSIAVDASGNVYTTGVFQDTVDFDPGSGTHNLTSAGSSDIFIQKLDANGNFLYAKSMGGSSSNVGISIAVDTSGDVYSTGYFSGTVDLNQSSGTHNLTSAGNDDFFIQKLDANGNFLYAISIGGSSNDRGYSIAVDASGNVYTTGDFQDTADFDPSCGTYNLISAGYFDIFIQKLKPAPVSAKNVSFTSSQSIFTSPPFNVSFTNTSVGYQSYSWDFGDGSMSNFENPTHTYQYNENYTVRLFATDSISNTTDTATAVISCSGGTPNPCNFTAELTQSQSSAIDTSGKETPVSLKHKTMHLMVNKAMNNHWNLIWRPYEGFSFGSYKIYRGTDSTNMTLLTTIASSNLSYTDLTNPSGDVFYQIEVVSTDPCGAKSYGTSRSNSFNTKNASGLGVNAVSNNGLSMMLFPNPNKGKFTLEINSTNNKSQDYQLEVYSVMGKLIHQENISGSASIKKQMHFEALSKGVYFIRLRNNNVVLNGRFVVE